MSTINFTLLEEFLDRGTEDIDQIQFWYERLSEYELDGKETQHELDTLLAAMKTVAHFSFAAAEELKEVAEGEAVAMAEREAQWEEQRQQFKEEIEDLRDKIAGGAEGLGEGVDALKNQVDALKEENRQLRQENRDRDREIADQRDRFENLVARTEALQRERDTLLYNRTQMEDTIREMNRRISSKSEERTDWETRKLRQRNEQAAQLSEQIHVVVAQNDELREEITRLSAALEQATKLIEDTGRKYANLTEIYENSKQRIVGLSKEIDMLNSQLNDKEAVLSEYTSEAHQKGSFFESTLEKKNQEIAELNKKLGSSLLEIQELRLHIRTDTTAEKEQELERLRDELVAATKMARSLFGTDAESSNDPTTQLRYLTLARADLAQNLSQVEGKDSAYADLAAQHEKLQELKYGDQLEEVKRLQTQLRFRDEQIQKLVKQSTMLQIELGRYAELGPPPKRRRPKPEGQKTEAPPEDAEAEQQAEEEHDSQESPKISEEPDFRAEARDDVKPSAEGWKSQGQKAKEHRQRQAAQLLDSQRGDVETQAILIATLYEEMMQLLTELDAKDEILKQMATATAASKRSLDLACERLGLAHKHIEHLEKERQADNGDDEAQLGEVAKVEIENALRAIELGGDELERRMAETSRKMVAEREQVMRLKSKLIDERSRLEKTVARLQYDLDLSSIETARLMEKLLRSVPLADYETLRIKYDALLKTDAFGPSAAATTTVTEQPLISLTSTHQKEEYDELLARNAYLKKMLEILTDQNEFWSRECDILQLENEEIKRFLEDMENRSDQREILGEIERRLLQTIREQAEEAMERDSEKRRGNEHFNRFEKAQGQWQAQKRHLMHAVQLLQTTLQKEKNNRIDGLTLDQIEIFRSKIGELIMRDEESQEKAERVEKIRLDVESQLRSIEANRKTQEIADAENHDPNRVKRALNGALLEVGQLREQQRVSQALVIVRTIVKDNRKPFEEQFARMKKATQICIQTYKEQLAQREEAIEHYKKLLKERMEEPPREASQQTEPVQFSNPTDEATKSSEKAIKETPATPTIPEFPSREYADPTLPFKNEIRTLKERVRRLTTANKDLLATCEKIRDDALQELEAKRNRLATQGDAETTRLRTECERLRRETRALQRTVAIQNETIRNTQNSEERKNATEEVAKWHEKKKAEQTIVILKKRLKEIVDREDELKGQIEKRDRRIEEMKREEAGRQTELERMERRLRDLRSTKSAAEQQLQQIELLSERLKGLETQLSRSRQENAAIAKENQRLQGRNSEMAAKLENLQRRPQKIHEIETQTSGWIGFG
ncbi:unnamed protein product, partial [Mesorhabditis spiculigera]